MEKRLLLKTQRNAVLSVLQGNGLDPVEFDWGEEVVEKVVGWEAEAAVSTLTHGPTGYRFLFDMRGQTFWAQYSPGREKPRAYESCDGWEELRYHVVEWAQSLKGELDAPDLWAAVAQSKALPAAAAAEENTPFTPEEQQRLVSVVVEIENRFSTTRDFSPKEKQYLHSEFEYLQGALTRQGRKEWLYTAVGVVASAIISLALSEHAGPLMRFVWSQISNALGLPAELGGLLLE